jgi:homoserine O-succinyltransferase/O-acetyltransferase
MPITIPSELPARTILEQENIFIMDENRAIRQDIRRLNIVILNLMPQKEKTETQLLRLLGNTPLQVKITLMRTESYDSKNTKKSHLNQFYSVFSDIKHKKYDGMIITGAPIEHLPFEQVSYWEELKHILEWSKTNVTSTMHICWGAQAGLYFHYGINKYTLKQKCFGVFPHKLMNPNENIVRGFDETHYIPHSRHTNIYSDQLKNIKELSILSYSEDAGTCLIV